MTGYILSIFFITLLFGGIAEILFCETYRDRKPIGKFLALRIAIVFALACVNSAGYFIAAKWPSTAVVIVTAIVVFVLNCTYIAAEAAVDVDKWYEVFILSLYAIIAAAIEILILTNLTIPGKFMPFVYGVPIAAALMLIAFTILYALMVNEKIENDWLLPICGAAAAIIAILLLLALIIPLVVSASSKPAEPEAPEIIDSVDDSQLIETVEPEPEPEPEVVEAWYHFFNLDLQDDDDDYNDLNFGPDPYAIETEVEKDAKWMDAEFRRRLRLDPDLLSADAAYNDSIVGTRYMGEFYDTAKQDWSKAMNDAVDKWMEDEDDFHLSEETFEKWLDTAVRVEIWTPKEYKMKITDMMYMDPFVKRMDSINKEPIPDIIAMETGNLEGNLLVYVFLIKNKEFYVPYRIQCGFQPVNVVKAMKITPTKKPDKPTTPPPDNPPTTPNPKKDPTEGTQGDPTAPNDDPSPGPNTNNPDNPNVSSEDENPSGPPNPKDWDEIEDINKPKPVEPVQPDPNVKPPKEDDNEDDLDKPQPTPDPATTDDGKPIDNNPSNPGEEWEGPPD